MTLLRIFKINLKKDPKITNVYIKARCFVRTFGQTQYYAEQKKSTEYNRNEQQITNSSQGGNEITQLCDYKH